MMKPHSRKLMRSFSSFQMFSVVGLASLVCAFGAASCSDESGVAGGVPDGSTVQSDGGLLLPDGAMLPVDDGGPNSITRAGYIGLPYSSDGRGRMQPTKHSEVDIVFVAASTSALVSFATEIISNGNYSTHPASDAKPGYDCNGTTNNEDGTDGACAGSYSSGHGGTIQLDIYADDPVTHEPRQPSLGSHTWNEPMLDSRTAASPNGRGFFTKPGNDQGSWQGAFPLTPQPNVTAGARYHAVFSNPHPDADKNWYGVNTMQQRGGRRRDASQSVLSKLDFDVRFRGRANANGNHNTLGMWRSCSKADVYSGGSGDDCWGSSEQITAIPVFFATYSDGKSSGNGYEINIFPYANPAYPSYGAWGPASDGTTASRQTLNVPVATKVDEIGAHILPVIGSGPGVAVLNLKRLSDNTLIKSVSIPYTPPAPLSTPLEGENGMNIAASFAPVDVPAGDYYVEYQRTAGTYFPMFLRPFLELDSKYWTNTGVVSAPNVLPPWPAGSRMDTGFVQFQDSAGGAWRDSPNPIDSMVYLRTVTVTIGGGGGDGGASGLSPLTVTISAPANGATVAPGDNGEAQVSTDATCTAGPVTFFVDGVQANVETTATWVTFPWNAPAGGLKTSPALGAGMHAVYAVAKDTCGRTATSATVSFKIQ
jgi:hypothetical protein